MQKEIYNVYKKIKGLHFGKDEIVGVEQLGGGRVNSIFKVQTKDKIYTIKLQNNMDSTCKQAIGNEKYILKKYDKLVKYIPKVYYLDADGERLGYKYIILEYVKGNTLNNVGKENFYLAGKTLAKIHSNSSKYIGKIQQRKEINSYEDVEKYYLQYFSETMFSLCKIDKKLAESVQEFLKNKFSVSYYKNEKIALIHNDVHPRNIIVEEGEIKYIDWDCSRFAHREADFVKLRHLSRNSTDEESIKFFLKGYNEESEITFTPNFVCHEIVWLAKMIVFESLNPIKDNSYFPNINYYKNEILRLLYNS